MGYDECLSCKPCGNGAIKMGFRFQIKVVRRSQVRPLREIPSAARDESVVLIPNVTSFRPESTMQTIF